MNQEKSIDELISSYVHGGCSRRTFMARAAALGLSLSAANILLAESVPAALAAPELKPVRGGTFRFGYDMVWSRMDPVNTNHYDPPFQEIYETIVTADPRRRVVPMIAEAWTQSKDGKTLTFKIRKGLKFHDGRPCNAHAIVEFFKVIRNKNSGNPNYGFYSPLDSVTARGNTVVFKFAHPYYDFAFVINNGYAAIPDIKLRNQLGAQYGTKAAAGTGPFELTSFTPGGDVTVKRWNKYPGSIVPFFSNKGKAHLDGIVYSSLVQPATRTAAIQSGNVDAIRQPAFQDVATLKKNKSLRVISYTYPSLYFMGLNFQMPHLGFHDVRVRQAISHAIDRNAIVKHLFFGQATAGHGLLSKGTLFYSKEVEKYNNYSLAKSRSLLNAAGWKLVNGVRSKNGQQLSFTMVTFNDPIYQELGQAIQSMLGQLGIQMHVQYLVADNFYSKVIGGHSEAYLAFYDWPNPFDIAILFTSTATRGSPNWQNASIPALDKEYKAWQSARNPKQLQQASAKAQLIAAKELPFIPVVTPHAIWVLSKKVHGFAAYPYNLWFFANDIWLSK
jgi:peptide/nickel transport system substrate-binding protein